MAIWICLYFDMNTDIAVNIMQKYYIAVLAIDKEGGFEWHDFLVIDDESHS